MKKLLAITLLILSSCFVFSQDKKLTLLKDGKSDYVIIIPKDYNKKILYAAELFQKDVEKVTGCLLPIITDNNRTSISYHLFLAFYNDLRIFWGIIFFDT